MKVLDSNRAIYRKQIKNKKICEFCNTKNIKKQECTGFDSKHWRILVNKYPYMDGNLMIVPKRHIKDTAELNEDEKNEFFSLLEVVKSKLTNIFETKDFNISINIGKKAGSSINHMHWQIIPRKDKILNASNIFSDIYVITISPEQLKRKIEGLK